MRETCRATDAMQKGVFISRPGFEKRSKQLLGLDYQSVNVHLASLSSDDDRCSASLAVQISSFADRTVSQGSGLPRNLSAYEALRMCVKEDQLCVSLRSGDEPTGHVI